jgi:hypothetical protein
VLVSVLPARLGTPLRGDEVSLPLVLLVRGFCLDAEIVLQTELL